MSDEVTVSITEVTMLVGKKKAFKLKVDDRTVTIPVDEAIFTNYQNQFYREKPTPQQRRKFTTLMNLMRAAYKQGVKDGRK
jgi:hypothetical protein